jgi:hypothetical protein
MKFKAAILRRTAASSTKDGPPNANGVGKAKPGVAPLLGATPGWHHTPIQLHAVVPPSEHTHTSHPSHAHGLHPISPIQRERILMKQNQPKNQVATAPHPRPSGISTKFPLELPSNSANSTFSTPVYIHPFQPSRPTRPRYRRTTARLTPPSGPELSLGRLAIPLGPSQRSLSNIHNFLRCALRI